VSQSKNIDNVKINSKNQREKRESGIRLHWAFFYSIAESSKMNNFDVGRQGNRSSRRRQPEVAPIVRIGETHHSGQSGRKSLIAS